MGYSYVTATLPDRYLIRWARWTLFSCGWPTEGSTVVR